MKNRTIVNTHKGRANLRKKRWHEITGFLNIQNIVVKIRVSFPFLDTVVQYDIIVFYDAFPCNFKTEAFIQDLLLPWTNIVNLI